MDARVLTDPSGSALNEDAAGVLGEVAVVVDGAGIPERFRAGCRHSVAWYSHHLASALLLHAQDAADLREALAAAIGTVASLHGGTCDLEAGSPSATVTAVRIHPDHLEHLVLCDCSLLLRRRDGSVERCTDDRVDRIQPAEPTAEAVEALRNAQGGFWVARHEVEAAEQALVGTAPLDQIDRVHLMSDGITRTIDLLGTHDAAELEAALASDPRRLLHDLRSAEAALEAARRPRKMHDDASVISIALPPHAPASAQRSALYGQ